MYFKFKLLHCNPGQVDNLQDTLFQLGAVSASLLEDIEAPIYEPTPGTTPYWQDSTMEALFDNFEIAKTTHDLLKSASWQTSSITEVVSEGWEKLTQEAINPMQFGEKLWIYPSWIIPDNITGSDVIIKLDPGLAFGTGNHSTTKMCLEWLDANNVNNMNGMDYGCGSGVLAIAALKLGASNMIALDLDPQALQATKQNALQNDITNNLSIVDATFDFTATNTQVDFILANILLTPLIELKPKFHALLKNNGKLVMTGILQEQLETILQHYQDLFTYKLHRDLDGWVLVELEKNHD